MQLIQQYVQNPIALAVLEGEFGEGDTINVTRSTEGNKLEFAKAESPEPEPANVDTSN